MFTFMSKHAKFHLSTVYQNNKCARCYYTVLLPFLFKRSTYYSRSMEWCIKFFALTCAFLPTDGAARVFCYNLSPTILHRGAGIRTHVTSVNRVAPDRDPRRKLYRLSYSAAY